MTYRNPKRYFEKSGLVDPAASYHVRLENVVNMDQQDMRAMVDAGRYFSIFAPRQSGKTTFFRDFCDQRSTATTSKRGASPVQLSNLQEFERHTILWPIRKNIYWSNRVIGCPCMLVHN